MIINRLGALTLIFFIPLFVFGQNYTLKFDGADDFVDLGNPAEFNVDDHFTVSLWVKSNFNNKGQGLLAKSNFNGSVHNRTGWVLNKHSSNHFCFRPFYNGWGANTCSFSAYTDTLWHHVAVRVDHGLISMFVDGIMQPQIGTMQMNISSGPMVVGKSFPDYSGSHYQNEIDEVAFWGAALTNQEIQSISCSQANHVRADSLFGYWKFNSGSGTIAIDSSGRGNKGLLVNGPKWVGDYHCNFSAPSGFQPQKKFQLYPNPASSYLIIDYEFDFPIGYQIYSQLGEMVLKNDLHFRGEKIDLENLTEGVYILKIGSLKTTFTKAN